MLRLSLAASALLTRLQNSSAGDNLVVLRHTSSEAGRRALNGSERQTCSLLRTHPDGAQIRSRGGGVAIVSSVHLLAGVSHTLPKC